MAVLSFVSRECKQYEGCPIGSPGHRRLVGALSKGQCRLAALNIGGRFACAAMSRKLPVGWVGFWVARKMRSQHALEPESAQALKQPSSTIWVVGLILRRQ